MACFDYTSYCAHPRKCKRLMRDFLQDATTLTYEDDETGEECTRVIKIEKGPCFETSPYALDVENIHIEYNFSQLTWFDSSKLFNRNFYKRSPMSRGFSSLTIALLHELGHHETLFDVPDNYDRVKAEKRIMARYAYNLKKLNEAYFKLKDEILATDWAIGWLSNPENRKKAQRFEKEFFKAWRGEK